MSYKNITQQTLNTLTVDFLATQENKTKGQYHCTRKDMAFAVLYDLKKFLFAKDIAKEGRRAQYLILRAEFEGETT